MNNNIQCSIESSTTKIELNSAVDGVFLVPELEGLVGLPEIRTTSGVNAGYDGGWTSAQNYDARLISIRGVIANPDISKVEDKRRAIASLLGQGRKEQLTLRFTTEAGNAYAISVRTISCEMALQRVLTTQEFLIQLRADDPLIYDDGTTGGIAAILQPQRALGGFEINFGLPLAIGGGAEDTVVDNGNETVYPVIKLYGALHSPTVVNRTTNQQMQILADLQYSIDWHTYRSATGDYILVNDGLDGAPMTLSQLTGNAKQTTYSGKNLLYATELPKTQSNVTATYQDGIFRLSGTSSTATNLYILPYTQSVVHLEAGESVTMYIERVSGTSKVYFTGYFEPDDASATDYDWGLTLESGASSIRRVKTASKAGNLTHAQMFINASTTYNSTVKILVQKGDIAIPTWEPYVGGIPAPNPSYPQPISTVTGAQNIKVGGKNLLPTTADQTLTNFGIDFTVTNGTITASGETTRSSGAANYDVLNGITLTGNYYAYATLTETNTLELPAGTYTLSATITNNGNTDGGLALAIGTLGGIADLAKRLTSTGSINITVSEGQRVYISFWYEGNANNKTVGLSISNIQLEKGSTATAYEPYQGQEYEVNLGKNLFSISQDTIISNAYLNNNATLTFADLNSVSITATGTQGAQYLYRIISGLDSTKSYTFSFKAIKNVKGSTGLPYIRITTSGSNDGSTWTNLGFSGNTNPTEGETYSFAKTLTGYSQYRFMIFNNVDTPVQIGETTTFFDMQLEEGAQTSFAPYFTPIELAKIGNYQDRIYKEDGKWYIEKQIGKVVFNGSTTLTQLQASTNTTRVVATISSEYDAPLSTVQLPLCDYFTGNSSVWATDIQGTYIQSRYAVLRANNTIVGTTLNSFKTWLSTHPTTVYYALATPTTTEITDETLLLQLNFLASLYEGENNISLVGTGAQGEMTVRYATDYTVNQDIITIDSQARTITLNGQDVYHLKTSESEFLVLAPGENKLYLTSEVSDDSGYAEVKFKQGYLSI